MKTNIFESQNKTDETISDNYYSVNNNMNVKLNIMTSSIAQYYKT